MLQKANKMHSGRWLHPKTLNVSNISAIPQAATGYYPRRLDGPSSSFTADWSAAEPHGRQLRGRCPADLTGVGRAVT